jgi:hypothetical protein
MIMSKIQFVLPVKWDMKKSKYIHLMILLSMFGAVYAGPRMALFFTPEPLTDAEKIHKKLARPEKVAKYTARGILQPSMVEGILATYGGYVTSSDYNGELSFPRKHTKNSVEIVITPEIVPVPLFENTILNWRRVPGLPAAMYECEQLYNEQKDQYNWQTREIPLSENMTIPLSAVVIIAKPKNMRMETSATPTHASGNFVLPNVYVKKGINITDNCLYLLTIRHFFKPVQTEENREPLRILTHIVD